MEEITNFKIKNFGPIHEGNIDIGKINIVGGNNSTGKSTASKVLYCFLKSNSNKRQEFAYESISGQLRSIISNLKEDFRFSQMRNMNYMSLIYEYEKSKEDYYKINHDSRKENLKSIRYRRNRISLDEEIQEMDNLLDEIRENGNSLYLSIMRNLLRTEFLTKDFNCCFSIKNFSDDLNFEFSVDFIKHDFDSDNAFKSVGSINVHDVFYIDSFSIFDLSRRPSSIRSMGNAYYDHIDYLNLMLRDTSDESKALFDDKKNKNVISVEKKVEQIIGGKIEYDGRRFAYIPKESEPCEMQNTASGIKQIGVIQLLLSNRKLKKNSFLIIDEPEVNLHPEWQFKLAQILILLVKDLNISLYLNTHSPMFIEAMEVITKYYNLDEDTNFYLTQKSKEYGYEFTKIDYDNLNELYDNLSKPFDAIEVFRLKNEYKKDIDGGI